MVDNAFEYATKHNLIRTNEMHGEVEAKLILEDGFSHEHKEEESSVSKSNLVVEEPYLQFTCPRRKLCLIQGIGHLSIF